MRQVISTKEAPGAIGPYNQAIVFEGKLMYTAGQIPLDPITGEMAGTDIKVQTRQALTNLRAVLMGAGSGLEHVIKTTVFLKDMNDFAAMNEVYAEFFANDAPARSAVEVARLPKDALVEVECIALVP